jgi:diaminopimelate decarboxylase
VSLRDIAAQFGTPLLLADEARLRANANDLREGLRSAWPDVVLRYCAKTNHEPAILSILREENLDVLTSHEPEVRLALKAGFAAERIAFQKPVLDERELVQVIAAGVRRVHAFRDADLDLLARFDVRVSLRVALPHFGIPFLGAAARRMGFDPDEIRARPNVDAVNTYIGTQQERVEAYRPAIRALLGIARHIGAREVNLGGGVPSSTLRRVTPTRLLRRDSPSPAMPLREYAAKLGAIFAEEARGEPFRLVLEPGRSIVGNAVVLLTRVCAEKGPWRFLDCGRNVLVESPLAFTRPIESLEPREGPRSLVHLSGPTLNTLDVIDTRRRLPPLRVGDVLVIGDAGAYTLSRSTRYAGLPPPLYLARREGTIECIRPAETELQ